MAKTFNVTIEASYDMTVDEVWPNGDAPDNPTAEDVAAVMRAYGSAMVTLDDWNLDDDLDVRVDGVEVWV